MAGIPVHPVQDDNDSDSFSIDCTFRVQVLDVATGEPLHSAYAEKPAVDLAVLNRRGVHPFRILNERTVQFGSGAGDLDFSVKTLKTFAEDADASTPDSKALVATWKCVSEFFHGHSNPEVLVNNDGSQEFHLVQTSKRRFVCVRDGQNAYAERALITNWFGILEVPIKFKEWLTGTKITVKFRDYKILAAEDDFSPEKLKAAEKAAGQAASANGHKAMRVTLAGNPVDNTWSATVGGKTGNFKDEIEFELGKVSTDDIDFTVWAVRRARPLSDVVPADRIAPGSGNNSRQGIMIHYNSGYFVEELRPDQQHKALCRDAYTNAENRYMMDPNMAMAILRKINEGYEAANPGKTGRLGYNYHIDRQGTILPAVADSLVIWHAGKTREVRQVEATENVDTNPRTASHEITQPHEYLNSRYIGIDLLGYHLDGYHYTRHQHWYLDRLIENIRARNTGIEWYRIQGHDETRQAFRTHHGITGTSDTSSAPKTDPGAALEGEMTKLRGRHGATFT